MMMMRKIYLQKMLFIIPFFFQISLTESQEIEIMLLPKDFDN